MITFLCFLNYLCYNFQGQQIVTPVVGVVRSIDYSYTYTLSGAAVVQLNAQLDNYNQPYTLYYQTFDTDFTVFNQSVTFDLSLLGTDIIIIAENGNNILAFREFLIP